MSVSELRPRLAPPIAPVGRSSPAQAGAGVSAAVSPDRFVGGSGIQTGGLAACAVSENNFRYELTGPNPPRAAGGFFQELKQANELRKLAGYALTSVLSGGQAPPDLAVEARLRSLGKTPTSHTDPVSKATYTSNLRDVAPAAAYEHFVNNPSEVFGAAGLTLRPPPSRLEDGARVMIEDPGPPPLWMPVEVRLDPARGEVRFETLDGHPLRGFNSFSFVPDGRGGTVIDQRSEFQASSKTAKLGNGVFGGGERQHQTWRSVHAHLFATLQPDTVSWGT